MSRGNLKHSWAKRNLGLTPHLPVVPISLSRNSVTRPSRETLTSFSLNIVILSVLPPHGWFTFLDSFLPPVFLWPALFSLELISTFPCIWLWPVCHHLSCCYCNISYIQTQVHFHARKNSAVTHHWGPAHWTSMSPAFLLLSLMLWLYWLFCLFLAHQAFTHTVTPSNTLGMFWFFPSDDLLASLHHGSVISPSADSGPQLGCNEAHPLISCTRRIQFN